jgi:glycosyltransferase involved in cell wall biosynthesis
MPRDVPLHDGSVSDEDLAQAAPGRSGPVWTRAADLREAALKREIVRLTRERNRAAAAAAARSEVVDIAQASSPPAVGTANDASYVARIAAKDALIRALYASRSWRITAPLRAMSSRLLGRSPEPAIEVALEQTDAIAIIAPLGTSDLLPAPICYENKTLRCGPEGNSRGEVLVVAPHLPLFDRQGGGLRLKTLIGMIGELGWKVTFCAAFPADWGPEFLASPQGRASYEEGLRAVGVTRFVYGIDGIRAFLIESGGRMRYAFLSFPGVASDVTPLIRSHCPWARIIFDTVDLHFLRMQREAELRHDPALAREAARMRQLELACIRSADVTVAVSEVERRLLLDLAPDVVVETIPCVFQVPVDVPPGPARRAGLLFVGGFWHVPNVDAVLWFAEHVWPLIRARAPAIVFRIVGSDPTPDVLALGRLPGIEVLGYVPDLTPHLDAARVFVAPLRFGAGMKGKVAQSLINGLPVVATAIGAEGMSLVNGEHVLVADGAEDFAENVLSLLNDDGLWEHLQAQGRALTEATLSKAVVARRLETLFRV